MKKSEQKYIIALVLITLVLIVIRIIQPEPVDWSESYSAEAKKPFGAFILNEELTALFPEELITVNQQPVFELSPGTENHNLIFVNSAFSFDEFEIELLQSHVISGDYVFIAARSVGGALADSLNLGITQSFPSINPDATSLDSLAVTRLNFTNSALQKENGWSFPVQLTESYFSSFDTANTHILGFDNNERVNFIKMSYGEGAYLIHTSPFLFTNYFLRDTTTYDYAFKALSYLPLQHTIWDEYYKPGRLTFSSPMAYIISNDNLKVAWWIMIFGLIAYLVLNGRRTQRIIPTIKPVTNTSIEFAETIANLYLENGTHKDIFEKKVIFLKEYIRTNLNVNINESSEDISRLIASRSGVKQKEIEELFTLIDLLGQKNELTANELKRITERIDRFYKNTQR